MYRVIVIPTRILAFRLRLQHKGIGDQVMQGLTAGGEQSQHVTQETAGLAEQLGQGATQRPPEREPPSGFIRDKYSEQHLARRGLAPGTLENGEIKDEYGEHGPAHQLFRAAGQPVRYGEGAEN